MEEKGAGEFTLGKRCRGICASLGKKCRGIRTDRGKRCREFVLVDGKVPGICTGGEKGAGDGKRYREFVRPVGKGLVTGDYR